MTEADSNPDKGQLFIGTCGWDWDDWVGTYYPEELPNEWRLAYYCNDYRSVLVPASHWQAAPEAKLEEIAKEIDSSFSLVLELPARGMSNLNFSEERFFCLLQNYGSRLVALYWRPRKGMSGGCDPTHVARLATDYPMVLDYDSDHPERAELEKLRKNFGASRPWCPQRGETVPESVRFLLTLVNRPELVFLRGVVEQIEPRLASGINGGIFFKPTPDAPRLAEQCRILADLLEI